MAILLLYKQLSITGIGMTAAENCKGAIVTHMCMVSPSWGILLASTPMPGERCPQKKLQFAEPESTT